MKKMMAAITSAALGLMAWMGRAETDPTKWDDCLGAAVGGVYEISDVAEFKAFATYAQTLGTANLKFALMADIDLSKSTLEDGSTTVGIGAQNMKDVVNGTDSDKYTNSFIAGAFRGEFDGRNHTISGVILPTVEYGGLFMSTYGATIKDLKVSLGNATGFAGTTGDFGGGVIAGVTVNTVIENCETVVAGDHNTFKGTKATAGIVGYAGGATTLRDCVNNLNIESSNEKVAGFAGCAENGKRPEAESLKGHVFENCTNNGAITCTKTSGKYAAGFAAYSYTDKNDANDAIVFKGTCAQNGTVKCDDGAKYSIISLNNKDVKVTFAEGAVVTTKQTDVAPANFAVDGLNFATIATVDSGSTATFVSNAAASANGASTKVMISGQTLTLATENDSIKLNQSMATATVEMASNLSDDDYEITKTVDGDVTTYTLVKKAVTPTINPVEAGTTTQEFDSDQAASDAAAAINAAKESYITVPNSIELTAEQKAAYVGLFTATANGKTVTVDFTEDAKTNTLVKAADAAVKTLDLQTFAAKTDGEQTLAVTGATPGLYYTLLSGTDTPADLPTVNSVQAGKDGNVSFTVTKSGTKAFFKIVISAHEITAASKAN